MESNIERTYQYLMHKYNRTMIGKREIAEELNVSQSSIDLYISKGIGVPKYKKLGNAKNSRVLFNIYDVAVYLNSQLIETL